MNFRTFRLLDDDGNKKLNLEEFTRGLEESGLEVSEDHISEIFQKFDTDSDGSVSVDEFLVGLRVGASISLRFTKLYLRQNSLYSLLQFNFFSLT